MVNSNADYPSSPPASNSDGTLTAAAMYLSQAKLLLLRQATETVAWRQRSCLRETADKIAILVDLVSRLSRVERSADDLH